MRVKFTAGGTRSFYNESGEERARGRGKGYRGKSKAKERRALCCSHFAPWVHVTSDKTKGAPLRKRPPFQRVISSQVFYCPASASSSCHTNRRSNNHL